VFVEADIQGEMSRLCCLDYIFFDERIKKCGAIKDQVRDTMKSVGFSDHYCDGPVVALSGSWRMKLALARAMLQRAGILLLDEPTNRLDVINVAWVENYL
jgi:elongation factor 3